MLNTSGENQVKNETVTPENQNELATTKTEQTYQRKTYHTPKLLKYGGLSELVQINPNLGRDGGGLPDCTLT
jgi:hypothetical protein